MVSPPLVMVLAEVFDGVPTRFPGLRSFEAGVLERFARMTAPSGRWTVNLRFPYPETGLPPGLSVEERKMLLENRAKRIEGILETATEVWLVEVKARVSSDALGALLLYDALYRQHFPTVKRLVKVCVAEADDVIARPVLEAHGVRVFVV